MDFVFSDNWTKKATSSRHCGCWGESPATWDWFETCLRNARFHSSHLTTGIKLNLNVIKFVNIQHCKMHREDLLDPKVKWKKRKWRKMTTRNLNLMRRRRRRRHRELDCHLLLLLRLTKITRSATTARKCFSQSTYCLHEYVSDNTFENT